jgi:hypothetical protein
MNAFWKVWTIFISFFSFLFLPFFGRTTKYPLFYLFGHLSIFSLMPLGMDFLFFFLAYPIYFFLAYETLEREKYHDKLNRVIIC